MEDKILALIYHNREEHLTIRSHFAPLNADIPIAPMYHIEK